MDLIQVKGVHYNLAYARRFTWTRGSPDVDVYPIGVTIDFGTLRLTSDDRDKVKTIWLWCIENQIGEF